MDHFYSTPMREFHILFFIKYYAPTQNFNAWYYYGIKYSVNATEYLQN